jgi:hypothetical protein
VWTLFQTHYFFSGSAGNRNRASGSVAKNDYEKYSVVTSPCDSSGFKIKESKKPDELSICRLLIFGLLYKLLWNAQDRGDNFFFQNIGILPSCLVL